MLSKKSRIARAIYPKERSLKSVRGKYVSISTFVFSGNSRFSFSISKKISKTAILRNKIRRQGYKVISNNLKRIKDNFLVRLSIHTIPPSFSEFETDIENLLIKTDMIKQ